VAGKIEARLHISARHPGALSIAADLDNRHDIYEKVSPEIGWTKAGGPSQLPRPKQPEIV
jgi:hypothetical protein